MSSTREEPIESVRLGERVAFRAGAGDAVVLEVEQAAGTGVPVHVHPAQEERIAVDEGAIDLRVGRARSRLGPGDEVTVPPNTPHGFQTAGDRAARLTNEFRPGLQVEGSLAASFALERSPRTIVGRALQLGLVADAYPREFPFYLPVVPWRAQLAALRAAAALAQRVGLELPRWGPDDRLLGVYLNDQLAAGVLWREIAARACRNNAGTELGNTLDGVAAAIAEDVRTFERMMDRLGIPRSRAKPALAIAAERVGRLKLNGRLRSYSPLSRFVELEALVMGIEGKKVLWQTVGDIASVRSRVPDFDFDELIARAERQRASLEPFRAATGRDAFSPP